MKHLSSEVWKVGKIFGEFGISIVYEEREESACITT